MSKIVSPYPPLLDEELAHRPPAGASWWRLRLSPNDDGNLLMMRCDAKDDMTTATWCEWEFFDGHNAIIDTGFDKPTKVRLDDRGGNLIFIDILYDGPPTPSSAWRPLTQAGHWHHPDDGPGVLRIPNT